MPPESEIKPFERVVANLLINDFRALLKKHKLTVDTCGVSADDFSVLARFYQLKIIDKKQVVKILADRLEEVARTKNTH